MIALIDNYDSFTYNIYHYILHFIDDIEIVKNTESIRKLKDMKNLDAIVLSPGPSHPKNSLLTLDAIDYFKGRLPMLGVCLGMQAIGFYFGAAIRKANKVMHGKKDTIKHNQELIFKGVENPMDVIRYHSLVVDDIVGLDITARSLSDNEIMAIQNDDIGIFGVQFHPESYLTSRGIDIIKNFLGVVYD